MTDLARAGPEGETPVNPYSLLEAVNDSSDTAHTAWLIFLGVMTYFMIAVAGVSHKDLLLETAVSLPILQVDIQLTQFFQFAPIVLVLMHLGVVSQLVLLARKTLEFDHAIRMLETTDRRTHPLRLELNNFFFVQAIAGPHRSAVMSGFLHAMSWLTLVILPVVLILFIQVVFLPYHDVGITWTHRVALLVDIGMLVLIGVFLMRAETSFFTAFVRTTMTHPWSFLVTSVLLSFVALFSLLVATVPGENLDRVMRSVVGEDELAKAGAGPQLGGFVVPFFTPNADGSLFGIVRRNLHVTDSDLVIDKDYVSTSEETDPSISLRGRDLRYAKLDRSDLHRADLTGADLSYASMVGTDLRRAFIQCADVNELLLTDRATAKCPSARGANLTRALLTEAQLAGIDLREAKLEEAKLEGANLSFSQLAGAYFFGARLEKAELNGGIQAQGANFSSAVLQGADLTGAQLQGADFTTAQMQGAVLSFAHLQAANLSSVDLEAGTLHQATLFGANLAGAKITGADLAGAIVWQTTAPAADVLGMADLSFLSIRPPEQGELATLREAIEGIDVVAVRVSVRDKLKPVLDENEIRTWGGSAEQQKWQALAAGSATNAGDAYRTRLTDYLTTLMCKSRWSTGTVATGIARRAITKQNFRGDLVSVYDRLKVDSCPASRTVPVKVLRDLAAEAEAVRVN